VRLAQSRRAQVAWHLLELLQVQQRVTLSHLRVGSENVSGWKLNTPALDMPGKESTGSGGGSGVSGDGQHSLGENQVIGRHEFIVRDCKVNIRLCCFSKPSTRKAKG
jgi:hypothetical protein